MKKIILFFLVGFCVKFSNAQTDIINIIPGGNVGISSTAPVSSLEVSGSYGQKVTTITANTILDGTHNTIVCNNGSTAITVTLPTASTATGRVYIIKRNAASTANVTITPNPTLDGLSTLVLTMANQSVEVFSDGAEWKTRVGGLSGNATAWGLAGNSGTTASSSAIGVAANNNFIGTTDARDFVMAANGFERMRIASGGNVGIGILAPNAPLEVRTTTAAFPILRVSNDAVSGETGIRFRTQSSGGANAHSDISWTATGSETGNLTFRVPYTDERMRIQSDGNVGIGTTAPAQKLQVGGNADLTGLSNYYGFNNRTDLGLYGNGNYSLALQAPEGVSINIDANGNGTSTPFSIRENATGPTGGNALMTVLENGNTGIGSATPAARLDVKGGTQNGTTVLTDGYMEDVSGIVQGNYIPSHTWNLGSGSVGMFNANGPAGENLREWGDGPHGNRAILWKGYGAGNDADGGWDSNDFLIDHTKTYRVSIWVKRTGVNGTGYVYLGCGGTNVTYLNGTAETNPYFFHTTTLPQINRWYLIVGYIHGSGDASTTSSGGVYDGVTGQKVISFTGVGGSTDFKFTTSATLQRHRTYLYYNTNAAAQQFFWNPRFEEVNGKEPSIDALLGLSDYGSGNYVQNQTTADQSAGFRINGTGIFNGGNVGIGTTAPATLLNINLGAGDATVGTNALRIGGTGNYQSLELGIKGAYDGMISTYGNDLHIYAGNWRSAGATASENHNISFYTSQNGSTNWNTAKMYLQYTGNLGVGTTSPTEKLHINGGSLRLNTTSGETPYQISGYNSGTSLWEIAAAGTATIAKTVIATAFDWDRQISITYTPGTTGAAAGYLQIGQIDKNNANWTHGYTQFYTNGLERMRIASDGNVGIGTTSTGAKLEVAGQVKITGGSPAVGKVLTSDAAGLATWAYPTNPWESVGNNVQQVCAGGTAATDYEWGVTYNNSSPVLRVTCNSWNSGQRVCTYPPYPTGDVQPFTWGGACWIWGTNSTWDDACSGSGQALHSYYTQDANGKYGMTGGNGCNSLPTVYRRKL